MKPSSFTFIESNIDFLPVSLSEKIAVVFYILNICLSMVIVTYLWLNSKRDATVKSFICFQGVASLWLFLRVFEEFTTGMKDLYICTRLTYVSICFIGVTCLIFCLYFTGIQIKRSVLLPLLLPAVISSIIILTNYNGIFIKSISIWGKKYGPAFLPIMVFIYIPIIVGLLLIFKYYIKNYEIYKKQYIFLVAAVLLPAIINITVNIRIVKHLLKLDFDVTPVCFSLSFTFIALASFKYHFLNIVPIALKELVGSIKDSIMIIDNRNNIVYYNDSFEKTFKEHVPLENPLDANSFTKWLLRIIDFKNSSDTIIKALSEGTTYHVEGEITLVITDKRYFLVYTRPIKNKQGIILGRIASFNDITVYKGLLWELGEKNNELAKMNTNLMELTVKIKEYADTIEELAISKERNRFAKDAHDTLGHTMTALITLLEIIGIHIDKNVSLAKDEIKEAIKISKSGMNDLRRSIYALTSKKFESGELIVFLNELISKFGHAGINVDMTIDDNFPNLDAKYSNILFRICQEAMSNAVRHGKAQNISIIIKYINNIIKLYIFDDGQGCSNLNKGLGLTSMEGRVNSVNGTLVYGSDGESGFYINVEIPLAGIKNSDELANR